MLTFKLQDIPKVPLHFLEDTVGRQMQLHGEIVNVNEHSNCVEVNQKI